VPLLKIGYKRYKPQELRIEINAHQKAYALDDELRSWLSMYGCQLNSHFTGKNKWDTSFGVASMASLFGSLRDGRFQDNNSIELPSNEGSEGLKALVQQLITWKPDTKNPTDCVMALMVCCHPRPRIDAATLTVSKMDAKPLGYKKPDGEKILN
jgi:hypothetical protein